MTGESVWEPPTSTCPSVDASTSTSNDNNDVVEQQSREERKAERKRRREERAKERVERVKEREKIVDVIQMRN